MVISTIKADFQNSLEEVWDIVTSLTNYQWRSDLSKIDIVDESKFVEYTKDGYTTYFTVTVIEPLKRWEFDLENSNMTGHWTGLFYYKDGITTIEFTEYVSPKKFFLKPFVKPYLKKQQERYIKDLRKALEKYI